jgi:hypothetical protein
MVLSKERGFLFVHIYKNAGTSITAALLPLAASRWQLLAADALRKLRIPVTFGPQPLPQHSSAPEIIAAIGRPAFDALFSFAIVRNPWDWQVSLFHYMRAETKHHQHGLAKSFSGFDDYIRWRCREEPKLQKDFIYSTDGELLVDFVGRFENLDADFAAICSRIGVSASLPKLNISNTTPYREFYGDETRELVRRTFAPDIALFGYDF